MQLKIIDTQNKEAGKIELPVQFSEEFRPDLIKRAYFSLKSHERQPYGTDPLAGIRQSVEVSKRRRDYRGSYGIGQSRIPRKVMLNRGTRFTWVGAFIPSAVGGRAAFPPKAEKIWAQKINTKERRKSLRSAIAATVKKDLVAKRHKLPENYPFIISSSFEGIQKTKELENVLKTIGFSHELERTGERKIRAGMGTMRGRKYMPGKKGPLIIVAEECKLSKAAKNILGVDIIDVKHLNMDYLAPGAIAGRLTLWTESAITKMGKENLFM
jgi:large subunit ribosomal protein L4e